MKLVTASLLTCFVAAAGPVAAAAARRHKHLPVRCTPSSPPGKSRSWPYTRTLAANSVAQVYSLWESPPPPVVRGIQAVEHPIFGCVYGRRGAVSLGSEPWEDGGKYMNLNQRGDRDLVLTGALVAYEDYSLTEGLEGFRFGVTVRDLRTGTPLRHEPTGKRKLSGEPELEFGFGHTTAIVLGGDGAVAWIVEVPADEGGGVQIHATDSTGSTVLASGADINPSSLALAAGTLYWTQGGQPRSAALH